MEQEDAHNQDYHVITSLDVLSCDVNMYIIMSCCDGGELLQLPEISSDLVDLIQNVFLKEPNQRFTLEQVSAHRWMIPL